MHKLAVKVLQNSIGCLQDGGRSMNARLQMAFFCPAVSFNVLLIDSNLLSLKLPKRGWTSMLVIQQAQYQARI